LNIDELQSEIAICESTIESNLTVELVQKLMNYY